MSKDLDLDTSAHNYVGRAGTVGEDSRVIEQDWQAEDGIQRVGEMADGSSLLQSLASCRCNKV